MPDIDVPKRAACLSSPKISGQPLLDFKEKFKLKFLIHQLEYKLCLNYVKEREYYIKNILNVQHACDILFLFLHRGDENERVGKMLQDWFE